LNVSTQAIFVISTNLFADRLFMHAMLPTTYSLCVKM